MPETKAFYLTSEFWVTVATVVTALGGLLPVNAHTSTLVAGIVAAAYAISRGLAKSGVPTVPTALVTLPDEGDKGKP